MNRQTRRQFLGRAAAAAAVSAMAPYVVRSSALGADGAVSPSERIVMGVIGLGGRGKDDLTAFLSNGDVQMVAVCDCDGKRRDAGKTVVDKHYDRMDCKPYREFQELLGRKDINAVLIATGDNWHSLAAIFAAKAGKDIYCEKPLSVTVGESRAVVDTVRRYGTVFQCGTQRRSIARFRYAVDLARSGKLGQLKTLYAEKAPQTPEYMEDDLPGEPEPPPDVFDWDRWLGPATWRPYNSKIPTRPFWSKHLDFSGGAICEWGSHTVDLCQWANDADATSPIEYEPAEGTIVARYANGVRLVFVNGVWPLDVKFEGTEGSVCVDDDGGLVTEPASLRPNRDYGKGYPQGDHVRNFLDCVKSRHDPTSTAETAHRSITACHLANIARRLNRKVRWDPKAERCVNDPEADRYLLRPMRSPWHL
jgi:predicted dehydrogenase